MYWGEKISNKNKTLLLLILACDGSVSEDLDNQEIVSSEMSDSTNDNSELIGNDNGASDDSSAESSDIIPNSDSVGDSSEETTKNSTTIISSSSKVVNGHFKR